MIFAEMQGMAVFGWNIHDDADEDDDDYDADQPDRGYLYITTTGMTSFYRKPEYDITVLKDLIQERFKNLPKGIVFGDIHEDGHIIRYRITWKQFEAILECGNDVECVIPLETKTT